MVGSPPSKPMENQPDPLKMNQKALSTAKIKKPLHDPLEIQSQSEALEAPLTRIQIPMKPIPVKSHRTLTSRLKPIKIPGKFDEKIHQRYPMNPTGQAFVPSNGTSQRRCRAASLFGLWWCALCLHPGDPSGISGYRSYLEMDDDLEVPLCLMIDHDVSSSCHTSNRWYTLIYIDIHWYTLIYIDIHWYTLIYIDIRWYTLIYGLLTCNQRRCISRYGIGMRSILGSHCAIIKRWRSHGSTEMRNSTRWCPKSLAFSWFISTISLGLIRGLYL